MKQTGKVENFLCNFEYLNQILVPPEFFLEGYDDVSREESIFICGVVFFGKYNIKTKSFLK